MDEVLYLVTPFIVIVLLSLIIDKFMFIIQEVIHKIPYLPDKLEGCIAYNLILALSFLICWQGNFDIFKYLGIDFKYAWEGWLLTSGIISGGSQFVKLSFGMINEIPSLATTVVSLFKRS
jgi:hypothetical protein